MSQPLSVTRYAGLIGLALASATLAEATRLGLIVPVPALLALALRNHADDFAAVLLATVLLLFADRAAGAIWRAIRRLRGLPGREVGATAARARVLAAPVIATLAEAWVEVRQRTGGPFVIYTHPLDAWQAVSTFAGHKLDGVFDPWDLVTIGIAGLLCGLCVAWPSHARSVPAKPHDRRRWHFVLVTGAVVAAVLVTGASGGKGGGSGGSGTNDVPCAGEPTGIMLCLEETAGPRNPRVTVQVKDGTDWTDIFGSRKPPSTQGQMRVEASWRGQCLRGPWNCLLGKTVDYGRLGETWSTRFSLFREGRDVNLIYRFEAQAVRWSDGEWEPIGKPTILHYVSRLRG